MPRFHFVAAFVVVVLGCSPDDAAVSGSTVGSGGSSSASTSSSSSGGQGGAPPAGGCFAPGEQPPSVAPAGFHMPSLEDERAAYMRWGWTWDPSAEPNVPADPSYAVADVDIHGDTEADDLWSYTMMHVRTAQPGYLDRANAWARYFKEDYASCVGDAGANFCYDRDAFGADHLWGWGLVAYDAVMTDPAALAAAEALAEIVESLYAPNSPFGCLPQNACTHYGTRQAGRHLLLVTRVAEVTGSDRWTTLRDQIIDLLLASDDWDASYGTYFVGDYTTDEVVAPGAYAAGARIQSAFQLGVIGEAFDHAYRVTGREELRARLEAMAAFVDQYGLDPTYDYSASWFGIVDGQVWHSYSASQPVTFWDPVYTTSLVNTLMRGYRYTCDEHYLERAKHFFDRGNRGMYGDPTMQASAEGTVHHFVDTVFDSSHANFYLSYNKGELQYTYLLFEAP